MESINEKEPVLHRMRVRLHSSNLPGTEGVFSARTDSEAVLSVEDVCAKLKNRGGFTGDYDDLVSHTRKFLREMAYQLCDGFTVNTEWFSIHPVVGGYFDTVHGDRKPKKHSVTFRFRACEPLNRAADLITLEVEGSESGFIESCFDFESEAAGMVTPGGYFRLSGVKIKVKGNNPDVGVYFVSRADPSERYKVTGYLAANTSRKVTGCVPEMPAGEYGIEVMTQFTVGGIDLQSPRTIASDFTVRVG